MQNSDRPVGQRIGHGAILGAPPFSTVWAFLSRPPRQSRSLYVYINPDRRRAKKHDAIGRILACAGWLDEDSQPHGRSGDKLARKAAKCMIGQRSRRGY